MLEIGLILNKIIVVVRILLNIKKNGNLCVEFVLEIL